MKSLIHYKPRALSDPAILIIPKDAVLPEFLTNYLPLCKVPSILETYKTPIACAAGLYIPSVDVQSRILDSLHEMSKQINIDEIKPYLIHYMICEDSESVQALLNAYQGYQMSLEILKLGIQNIQMSEGYPIV